jgi:hypothetical protein
VIHFGLPWPVGHELVLWYFMREMRRHEGEAELEWKQWDPNRRVLRFVGEGARAYDLRPPAGDDDDESILTMDDDDDDVAGRSLGQVRCDARMDAGSQAAQSLIPAHESGCRS